MNSYTKESLENLRSKIVLIEVLSSFLNFKKSGIYYKTNCPFHDEKTPSFLVNQADRHYHCFGCGAHGDAISFLMNFQKYSFSEAVEYLAEKFHVSLETTSKESNEPSKNVLKDVLNEAKRFYNFYLLKSRDGSDALKYLYSRGIDIDFIKTFSIGLSEEKPDLFLKYMYEKRFSKELLIQTGLVKETTNRDFFSDRIMIPIFDAMGNTIGFTARKYKEETFGPKYINTFETLLFKKSRILFGLNYSRKEIAKQKKAILVEGQIDALRLIYNGYTIVVASQGTAFTNDHVKELINLGVKEVFICFDSDNAGIEAAIKTGHLFQKEAIETYVVEILEGKDPDSILIEHGPKYFDQLLSKAKDYLTFLINTLSKNQNMNSPAKKNEVIQNIIKRIKEWDHPLMVHESLRKLAKLTNSPEEIISKDIDAPPDIFIKREANVSYMDFNPDMVLEADLLRILFLYGFSNKELLDISKNNLKEEHFKIRICKNLFVKFLIANEHNSSDLLSIMLDLENAEERLFLSNILQKKVNIDKIKDSFMEIAQKILDRFWMEKREEIKLKIHSAKYSDEEIYNLAKEFDVIKNNRPQIINPIS